MSTTVSWSLTERESWQTRRTMLIDRWERFKGYDKWPEVHATIESERGWGLPKGGYERPDGYRPVTGWWVVLKQFNLRYHSPHGTPQSKTVWIVLSVLSALKPGDGVCIRCSPQNPRHIYLRDQTAGMFRLIAVLGVAGLFICVDQYVRSR